jgi:hypothetical protein
MSPEAFPYLDIGVHNFELGGLRLFLVDDIICRSV